ncbi:sister chromatid cohesion protein 1 [Coemansia sp. RSA 2706]|nr:sister chromatid cohesion protein 1 [Coemansia sp. RSA 2706]KAJ2309663.1 sister chromatid cohesion protein 1 [Coemansia sp. RSA 2705]KAJ2329074.1 sister chromatid cohesion protein 1 [Coemansia sp. RSA 2702]KAJ2368048.1 sister chromatid cohesion protein 1 [Coemansia sp. RSA 2610]KAJ2392758.1 sister chromatid cohesion protein 1 [Coemansia sp. RSA 2611]
MFYAEAILSKKGPLAKVWLAAHLERKLTKAQLLQASIPSSVGAIIGHDQGPPLALRLSGQLLLGVARIYARKARYLLEDCSEALVRIKMAFRPGAADITSDAVVASHNSITLPEALTEFDILLPSPVRLTGAGDITMDLETGAALNTSRLQDITLAEQQFDISAVARGDALGGDMALGEEDLLGRDDDFRLDLDEDFVLNLDGSALEPEVGRDAMQGLDESMVGIQPGDVSLLGKGADDSMMDIAREDLRLEADEGDVLRFGDESDMAIPSRLDDESMAPNTQEAALQEAEAEVLAAGAGAARQAKRRRLNLSELVANESTSLSPNEIRERLNDATDIVRVPSYLPATHTARLDDMSAAAVASRFLSADAESPFSALFAPTTDELEQQVPGGMPYESFGIGGEESMLQPELQESRVPEHEFEDHFRIEDAGDELRFGDEPDAAAQQLEAEVLLADKSIEQLERMEEESFQRQAEEERQLQKGVRLFTDTAPEHDEDTARLVEAAAEAEETEAAPSGAAGYSKNTIRAIRILDEASRTEGVPISDETVAADADESAALSYMKVAKDARRDDAVKLFFELLVLKSKDFIDVAQPAPFEDVAIVPRTKLRQAAVSVEAMSA